MSWFRKRPPQPVVAKATTPTMAPRALILDAVTQECAALDVEPTTAALLPLCLVRNLEGEAAAKELLDRVAELMEAGQGGHVPEQSPSLAAAAQNMHSLDRVIAALLEECVANKLDLTPMFVLGKAVTHRLGGEAAAAKYAEKVTALIEMTEALQKLEKACR